MASYVTAYPTPPAGSGTEPPLISNLGVFEGEVVPNLAMLTYGVDRQVRFYNRDGYLDYLFDVSAVILADYVESAYRRQRRTGTSPGRG